MDSHFRTFNRRQLQSLCKKNKIPANLTNVAMADALSALQFVQGMDELSIESPAATSRTYTTGSTPRTKSSKHQCDDCLRPSTVRTTRTRGTQHDNVSEEKENLSHLTPSVLPVSRQRAALTLKTQETTMSKVQGTRRSTRLAARNQISRKMDFGEITETKFTGKSDVDPVAESAEEIVDKSHIAAVLSDCSDKEKNKFENETSKEIVDKSHIAAVLSDCSDKEKNKFETDFNKNGAEGNICNDENPFKNKEGLDLYDVATDDAQEIFMDHFAADDASSVDIGIDLNISKEVESKLDFGLPYGMVFFQTEPKNALEDGIAMVDEKEVEYSNCAAESPDDEKDTDLEDLDPSIMHNAQLQSDGFADIEIEPKTEKQDAGIIKSAIEPKVEINYSFVEEAPEINFPGTFNAMELFNGSYSGYELSQVEAADSGVKPSMEMIMEMKEEELMEDLTGHPEVRENGVTFKQLDGDGGVLENQANPQEEENLTNNSYEEISTKKQDVSVDDEVVVTTAPSLCTRDMIMEMKEEELMEDLIGHPEVRENGVTFKQLDGDGGVLENQANPQEEEDLTNNSYVECSTKKQDISVDDDEVVVTTAPSLCTRDMASLYESVAADYNETLSNVGVGKKETDVAQLFVPTMNCLSPVKVSSSSPSPRKIPLARTLSSKTPSSGKRITMLVSDEMSGTDEENEKKGMGMENSEKQCWDERTSLRKLKKELKAKLEEKGNKNMVKKVA